MSMRDKIAGIIWHDRQGQNTPESVADAILATIKASVPELVWDGANDDFAYCTLAFAQYQVREAESGYYVQVDGCMSKVISKNHPTLEAAKAAAQAHHVAQKTDWMGVE